jgi:hypothetical protein
MTTTRMQQRRDSAADWTSNDPTLAAGEVGFETDTGLFKIGDGATAWTSLTYAAVEPQTTTDNALARFNGTAGQVQDSNVTLSDDDTLVTVATDATAAGLRVPHGTAPSSPTNGDIWTTTAGIYVRVNGTTIGPLISATTADVLGPGSATDNALPRFNGTGGKTIQGSNVTLSDDDTLVTVASDTTAAGLRVPHGAAPSSPTDGDMWTTTAGLYVRINGSTVGPLS